MQQHSILDYLYKFHQLFLAAASITSARPKTAAIGSPEPIDFA
jgi:hypothetical protein